MEIRHQYSDKEIIKDFEGDFSHVISILFDDNGWEERSRHYPWMTSIDPYGNTIFNHLQLRYLIPELRNFSDTHLNQRDEETIKDLITFLSEIEERRLPHSYVVFNGD
jgi:hypothetical protein